MAERALLHTRAKGLTCPRCESEDVEYLNRLRALGATADWWRCGACSHLFTRSLGAGVVQVRGTFWMRRGGMQF